MSDVTLSLSHFAPVRPSVHSTELCPASPHLYQHVGRVVEAHDQRSHPGHVVHVGEGDEGDGCQVVQEHDQEILGTTRDEEEHERHT